MVNLCSDNVSGALPQVVEALAAAASGPAMPYGADPWTERLEARLSEVFEREVAVLPVASGTAANVLSLAGLTPPWGAVYCHLDGHVNVDECGAFEFFSGGAKLIDLPGSEGRISLSALDRAVVLAGEHDVHVAQPAAVSITNVTEVGTLYTPAQVSEVAEVCRRHGLSLHMDGARFANAVAALGCSPAEVTWKAGVEVLSLGGTKGGCLAAEAVVLFDPAKKREMEFRRKKAGQLFSKMRFLSAQLVGWLEDGLWLKAATHANAMAARLGVGLDGLDGARLLGPVEANMAFVDLAEPLRDGLRARGHAFYPAAPAGPDAVRLVASFETTEADVETFLADARALAEG
ncbi:MAG: low specificity L-threonine aldolase [Rhodospirillum sp.]|nr:low specificity L-threonine aldolase [Rhodospirillum sp.]MCF8490027.1 low specificity L-threonine aldolase [Rhodospirillum sp.]MCF8499568.1 low specificity L-threonine aldolase [Rhodospirillum sp.]